MMLGGAKVEYFKHIDIQLFQQVFFHYLLHYWIALVLLSRYQVTTPMWVFFLGSLFCYTDIVLILCQYYTVLIAEVYRMSFINLFILIG